MRYMNILTVILLVLTLCNCATRENVDVAQRADIGELLKNELGNPKGYNNEELAEKINQFIDDKVAENLPEHRKNSELITSLFINVVNTSENKKGLLRTIQSGKYRKLDVLKWYFTYFPSERDKTLNINNTSGLISQEDQQLALLLLGEDPTLIFEASAIGETAITATPLIESVSIALTNQQENYKSTVKFKKASSEDWLDANPLYFEPLTGQLTGSIVYLKPSTDYEISIDVYDNDNLIDTYHSEFRTRPNSPPIDPDKIYMLEDIYDGGVLDLELLGIEGSPEAWAKIIGSKDTVVVAPNDETKAVNIGDNSYVYFENITVRGGIHSVHSYQAHHIWFNGCDIAQWGRTPYEYRNGKAYASAEATSPMNYDSGFYFKESGVVVVENCYVHDPNYSANSWKHGHPKGPNAFWANANHPSSEFKGQIILRNNVFTGSDSVRFNDVIEGRSNGSLDGGFVKNSAIYNNKLAYANDDIIEIDGGQYNVLVYDNDISHGYVGVSAIPAVMGPSYIFNNTIHNLGDERGKMWTAIKLGGLFSRPIGQVNVFNNTITVYRNGISASNFDGDSSFWVNARNNIIVTELSANMVGYNVYDPNQYAGSNYEQNIFYNLTSNGSKIEITNIEQEDLTSLLPFESFTALYDSNYTFTVPFTDKVNNFSKLTENGEVIYRGDSSTQVSPFTNNVHIPEAQLINENKYLNFNNYKIWSYEKDQDKDGLYEVSNSGAAITIRGNTWKRLVGKSFLITPQTKLTFEFKATGNAEIVGLGFDTNNRFWRGHLLKLSGSQNIGKFIPTTETSGEFTKISIDLGDYFSPKKYKTMYLVLDNDANNKDVEVTFKNVLITN